VGSSKVERKWLKSLKITGLIKQASIVGASGKEYFVDGYDPITNTIYELNGSFWHGKSR